MPVRGGLTVGWRLYKYAQAVSRIVVVRNRNRIEIVPARSRARAPRADTTVQVGTHSVMADAARARSYEGRRTEHEVYGWQPLAHSQLMSYSARLRLFGRPRFGAS